MKYRHNFCGDTLKIKEVNTMKYTKENIQEGIRATINALPITSIDKELLMFSIPQYPIEIEQNVLEWINNEPLTDINCHGESIVQTMQAWGFSNKDIPHSFFSWCFSLIASKDLHCSCYCWHDNNNP